METGPVRPSDWSLQLDTGHDHTDGDHHPSPGHVAGDHDHLTELNLDHNPVFLLYGHPHIRILPRGCYRRRSRA